MNKLKLEKIIDTVDFAFQPIVNCLNGDVTAYEALLRNYRECGYDAIFDIFDDAYSSKVLYHLELGLREKAVEKFTGIPDYNEKALFYNIDNRVLEMSDYSPGNTSNILNRYGLRKSNFYFELSERYEINLMYTRTKAMLEQYKKQHYKIVLDDYGSGYSGFQMLYLSEPDVIKIDRFFIESIDKDIQKKFFTEQIVNMAHIMGTRVVAEGVETIGEINVCRDIGCDLLQGYKVEKPQVDLKVLKENYYHNIYHEGMLKKRDSDSVSEFVEKRLKTREYLRYDCSAEDVISFFNKNREISILPIVNFMDQPVGVILENNIKEYLYTGNGYYLFLNKFRSDGIDLFLSRVPVIEMSTSIEKMLGIAVTKNRVEGVIITGNGKYIGIIDPFNLLKIINERKIIHEKDQNPLTRLPGIFEVNRHLEDLYRGGKEKKQMIILELENFTDFNRTHGFRLGDRLIVLLSEIIKKNINPAGNFIGHYGGDNFFVIPGTEIPGITRKKLIDAVRREFSESFNALSLDTENNSLNKVEVSVMTVKIDFSKLAVPFSHLLEMITSARKRNKTAVYSSPS